MFTTTADRIRHIFSARHPHRALQTAADLLGISFAEMKREIADGAIVAIPTGVGLRVPREELIAAALRTWPQELIECALGDEAATHLPEMIRLVELRARVPRYQREMLHVLARQSGTSVDAVLRAELDDVACAHAEELSSLIDGFDAALVWPETPTSQIV